MQAWAQVEAMLMGVAEVDLLAGEEAAAPCLAAYRGDEPAFAAFLRPFEQGAYHQPLTELLALAAPLRCDRLAFAATGRAWSLDDPIAPVTEERDLRQRVLMIECADGSGARVERRSVLVPFDEPVDGCAVPWGDPVVLPGTTGWIASVLERSVGPEMHHALQAPDSEIAAQLRRVRRLGHGVHVAPALAARLAAAPVVPSRATRPRMARRR